MRTTRAMLLVFLVCWTIATLRNYVINPTITRGNPIGFDGHIEIANSLAHGHGFVFEPGGHKVIHRPPVYATVLAPGTLLPKDLWRLYVAALNAAFLAGTAALVLKYAQPVFGPRVAALAFLIVGFHPFILNRAKTAHPAIAQMFLYTAILAATWLLWRAWSKDRPIPFTRAAAYGALLLIGALVHGTMIAHAALLLTVLGLAALWRRDWRSLAALFVSGLTFLALLAPWTYRNYKVTGMFIPVVGNSGLAYFTGNVRWGITQPGKIGNETLEQIELRHIGLPNHDPDALIQFRGFKNLENEKFANLQARLHIKNHPADFAKKVMLNAIDYYFPIIYFLRPPTGSDLAKDPLQARLVRRDAILMIIISLFNLVLVSIALAGVCWLGRSPETRKIAIIALLAWAAFATPYFPFLAAGNDQIYTFGVIPIVSILIAVRLLRPNQSDIKAAVDNR